MCRSDSPPLKQGSQHGCTKGNEKCQAIDLWSNRLLSWSLQRMTLWYLWAASLSVKLALACRWPSKVYFCQVMTVIINAFCFTLLLLRQSCLDRDIYTTAVIAVNLTGIHGVADGLSGFPHPCSEKRGGGAALSEPASAPLAPSWLPDILYQQSSNSVPLATVSCWYKESGITLKVSECGWQPRCFHLRAAAPSFSGGNWGSVVRF